MVFQVTCVFYTVTNWVFKYNVIVCLAIPFAATWWFAAEVEPVYSGNFVVIEIVLQLLIAIDIYAALLFVYFMNVPLFQKVCERRESVKAYTNSELLSRLSNTPKSTMRWTCPSSAPQFGGLRCVSS